jgi:hypothetical protein
VAVFADCAKIRPTGELAKLCPQPASKDWPSSWYVWDDHSPLYLISSDQFSPRTDALAMEFAKRAIVAQPGDYAWLAVKQAAMAFEPKSALPNYAGYNGLWYRFEFPDMHLPRSAYSNGDHHGYDSGSAPAPRRGPYDQWMIDYQRVGSLPGPVLGLVFLVGLTGVVRRFRDWGGPALLPWAMALALLAIPVLTIDYDFRYILPVIPFAFLAAGLAFARRHPPAPHQDEVIEIPYPNVLGSHRP